MANKLLNKTIDFITKLKSIIVMELKGKNL